MADEDTGVDTPTTPEPAMDNGEDTGAGADTPASSSEIAKLRAALKSANAEAKANRLKAKELSDASEAAQRLADEEQGKFRELYEAEQARAAQAIEDVEQLRTQMRSQTLSAALSSEASKLGFAEPGDVSNFIGADAVEFDDTGTPANVGDLVSQLAKSKPYLLSRTSVPNINSESGNGNVPAPGAMSEAQVKEQAARLGLSPQAIKDYLGME